MIVMCSLHNRAILDPGNLPVDVPRRQEILKISRKTPSFTGNLRAPQRRYLGMLGEELVPCSFLSVQYVRRNVYDEIIPTLFIGLGRWGSSRGR